jgi:hypothetical protein
LLTFGVLVDSICRKKDVFDGNKLDWTVFEHNDVAERVIESAPGYSSSNRIKSAAKKILLQDSEYLCLHLLALEKWLRPLRLQHQLGTNCLQNVPAIDTLLELTDKLEELYLQQRHFYAYCHLAWYWSSHMNSFSDRWKDAFPKFEALLKSYLAVWQKFETQSSALDDASGDDELKSVAEFLQKKHVPPLNETDYSLFDILRLPTRRRIQICDFLGEVQLAFQEEVAGRGAPSSTGEAMALASYEKWHRESIALSRMANASITSTSTHILRFALH